MDMTMFKALSEAAVSDATRWSQNTELLASTLELLHAHYLLTARANGAKQTGKPLRVPRPGDKITEKEALTPASFAQFLRSQ
jgi:hypothetical protein